MIKLIKLELQRINLRPYFISSTIFGIILLVFTYFVAYVAQVEQEVQFMTYGNIFQFTSAISILLFSVLSATMYAKLIIEEYSGKRLFLSSWSQKNICSKSFDCIFICGIVHASLHDTANLHFFRYGDVFPNRV